MTRFTKLRESGRTIRGKNRRRSKINRDITRAAIRTALCHLLPLSSCMLIIKNINNQYWFSSLNKIAFWKRFLLFFCNHNFVLIWINFVLILWFYDYINFVLIWILLEKIYISFAKRLFIFLSRINLLNKLFYFSSVYLERQYLLQNSVP